MVPSFQELQAALNCSGRPTVYNLICDESTTMAVLEQVIRWATHAENRLGYKDAARAKAFGQHSRRYLRLFYEMEKTPTTQQPQRIIYDAHLKYCQDRGLDSNSFALNAFGKCVSDVFPDAKRCRAKKDSGLVKKQGDLNGHSGAPETPLRDRTVAPSRVRLVDVLLATPEVVPDAQLHLADLLFT
ncbi:RFX-type winged-helix domain-containing protein [Mycena chlorophos]|uniref:RFX-type winged-helix domain-containing protein n=1 Tax=Mycena chlorophos TaxID=658473 RepID=A0A8H6TM72_MYCCL|nr:RFX-type winged-helix domain-containing protein [Mycena chlorophos]